LIRSLSSSIYKCCTLVERIYESILAERDTDIGVIAKLLGHADLESVNRYVLIDQTKIEATIRQKGFCS